MQPVLESFTVGDAVITKIPELSLEMFDAEALYPGVGSASVAANLAEMAPGSFDTKSGCLRQSIHAWLVRTPDHVVLVDTATGNDKDRPGVPLFDHLQEPFLDRLRLAGVGPEEVDVVLLTHLHADHVGWNTIRLDERWVPTFPNARYIFSGRERAYNDALSEGGDAAEAVRAEAGLGRMNRLPLPGVYEDSVVPVIAADQAFEIVVDGTEALPGFVFYPTPGHSIDHASIGFSSRSDQALFWGDVMHHPIQFLRPDWNSVFCEFADAATRSRHWAMERAAATGALVLTTHFAESSAGRVARHGNRFVWTFAGGRS